MEKKFSTILCLLLCITASAYTHRDPIRSRYSFDQIKESLVLERKWVPYPDYTDREGWDRMTGEYKDYIIRLGERYLDYEWKVVKAMDYIAFETDGNRSNMEAPLSANNSAIASLLAAELAEGKGRFIPQLVNGVFHTCEMSSWALSAHLSSMSPGKSSLPEKNDCTIELVQGGMSQMLSWTWYFLHDEFDKIKPEISRRLRNEIKYRELDPYLADDTVHWMGLTKDEPSLNNWAPWCTTNALISYMIMEDNPDSLARAVWKTTATIDRYMNCSKMDGACEEGPSYWDAAGAKVYDYLNALYRLTDGRISIFDDSQFRDMGEYIVRSYAGEGWVVNFADAMAYGGADSPRLIYRYGKAAGSSLMTGYAVKRFHEHNFVPAPSLEFTRFLEDLLYDSEIKNAPDVYVPSRYTWYPQTEFHYMSDEEGLFVAARGGYNNESHNHNDVGSFILYCDSLPVIIDVGVGTYTRQTFGKNRYKIWTMQSDYHNLPRINGISQLNGKQYKARDCKSTPTSFSCDIAGAYPDSAGIRSWVRSYSLKGKVLTIGDRFSLDSPSVANESHFMTWGKVNIVRPGVIGIEVRGRRIEMKYDPAAFTAEVETIEVNDAKIAHVWGNEIHRIILKAKDIRKSGKYTCTISKI